MPKSTALFLCPQFPLIGLVGYTTVLSVANKHAGKRLYTWSLHSEDGNPVAASNGISMEVTGGLADDINPTIALVISGYEPQNYISRRLIHWLHHHVAQGTIIGAIDTGPFIVAAANLAVGPVCIHPDSREAFAELYPELELSDRSYSLNGNHYWCAGGLATVSMALDIVRQDHGEQLCIAICEDLMIPPSSRRDVAETSDGSNLTMEMANDLVSHLDERETISVFAGRRGISRRTLERQFRSTLRTSPASFVLEHRLLKARALVTQTDLQILTAAIACDFSSLASFGRAYRNRFSMSAREDRKANSGRRLSPFYGLDDTDIRIMLPDFEA